MPTSNPLDILLAHDRWATRQIIDACAKLSDEKFHQRFDMGPGSLHDTITHIFGAMRVWADTLEAREQRPRIEGTKRTIAELITLQNETADDIDSSARRHPLDEIVYRVRDGKTYQFTRGAVLTHVATHAMHHRAQCLNMLRHVGVNPLPASSVAEWTRMGDSAS